MRIIGLQPVQADVDERVENPPSSKDPNMIDGFTSIATIMTTVIIIILVDIGIVGVRKVCLKSKGARDNKKRMERKRRNKLHPARAHIPHQNFSFRAKP